MPNGILFWFEHLQCVSFDAYYQINNFGEFVENQKITFSEVYDEFIATEAQAT